MTIHRVKVYATVFKDLFYQRYSFGVKASGNRKAPAELMLYHQNISDLLRQETAVITHQVLDKVYSIRNLPFAEKSQLKIIHLEIGIAAHGLNGVHMLGDATGGILHIKDLAYQIARLRWSLPNDYSVTELTIKLDCCYCAAGAEKSFAANLLLLLKSDKSLPNIINIRASQFSLYVNELYQFPHLSSQIIFSKIYHDNSKVKEECLRLFTCRQRPDGYYVVQDIKQIDTRPYIKRQLSKINALFYAVNHHEIKNAVNVLRMLTLLADDLIYSDEKNIDRALWDIQQNWQGILLELKNTKLIHNSLPLHFLVENLINRIKDSNPWTPNKAEYIYPDPTIINRIVFPQKTYFSVK